MPITRNKRTADNQCYICLCGNTAANWFWFCCVPNTAVYTKGWLMPTTTIPHRRPATSAGRTMTTATSPTLNAWRWGCAEVSAARGKSFYPVNKVQDSYLCALLYVNDWNWVSSRQVVIPFVTAVFLTGGHTFCDCSLPDRWSYLLWLL